MQTIRTTTSDHLADAAYKLAQIHSGAANQTSEREWFISGIFPERSIVIRAIDGEWNCGVDITILNRAGVIMAEATIHMTGMSPRFVAEAANSMNREITTR